jgi:hypothetical protein
MPGCSDEALLVVSPLIRCWGGEALDDLLLGHYPNSRKYINHDREREAFRSRVASPGMFPSVHLLLNLPEASCLKKILADQVVHAAAGVLRSK